MPVGSECKGPGTGAGAEGEGWAGTEGETGAGAGAEAEAEKLLQLSIQSVRRSLLPFPLSQTPEALAYLCA